MKNKMKNPVPNPPPPTRWVQLIIDFQLTNQGLAKEYPHRVPLTTRL